VSDPESVVAEAASGLCAHALDANEKVVVGKCNTANYTCCMQHACSCVHAYTTQKNEGKNQTNMQVIGFHLLADAMHACTHTHMYKNAYT
jgi:hypothetical protein